MPEDQEHKVRSIAGVLRYAKALIERSPQPDTASLDAALILSHVLKQPRVWFLARPELELSEAELKEFQELVQERLRGMPLAYITGEQEFWKHRFRVSPDVLIPRTDTETLVESALKRFPAPGKKRTFRVLDVGTGSGCLAISLSLEWPGAQITGWDISEAALNIARLNQNILGSSVSFEKRDALNPDSWPEADMFDLIISNPPYIAEDEARDLGPGVLEHEPHQALFAPDNGLAFYHMLARQSCQVLRPGYGCIMMETGHQQGEAVKRIFGHEPWKNTSVLQDLSGRDRVVTADRMA